MSATFDTSAFFADLHRQLDRVKRGARRGLEEMGREIAEGTRARLEQSDPDAAQTVSVDAGVDTVEVNVGAWDAGFIEFGTVNNEAKPAMRPAAASARAHMSETFKRAIPQH